MKPLKMLEFDSQLFRFPVARWDAPRLTERQAGPLLQACRKRKIACLYACFDTGDFSSLHTALRNGFVIADIKVTLNRDLAAFPPQLQGELQERHQVRDQDRPFLERLSREIGKRSRFAFDRNFPRSCAGRLYDVWMQNSIRGTVANTLFFVRDPASGRPVGFATGRKYPGYGDIPLVATAPDFRGRGLASLCVDRVCRYFLEEGYREVHITTQANNIAALRTYEKMGFRCHDTAVFLHWWDRGTLPGRRGGPRRTPDPVPVQ